MAFPVVASALTNAAVGGTAASTSTQINLPATVPAGAFLAIFGRIGAAGAPTISDVSSGATWTIATDESDATPDVTFIAYRNTLAAGTEGGGSVTLTHGNAKMSAVSVAFTGTADPAAGAPFEISAVAIGTTVNPNPAALTPTAGLQDYLWLAFGAWAGEQTDPPGTIPASYTRVASSGTGTAGAVASNCRCDLVSKSNRATVEDPGPWTISVAPAGWTAWTIAIKPVVPPKQTSTAEISLASSGVPETRTLHKLVVRARKTDAAHSGVIRAQLFEGGTARSAVLATPALTTSFAAYTLAVADADAAAITSYADLSVRLTGYSAAGTATVFEVSQLYLEVPGGGGKAASLADPIALTDAPRFTTPGDADSVLLDGVDDRITTAVGGANITGAFTVAAIVKKTADPVKSVIVACGTSWRFNVGRAAPPTRLRLTDPGVVDNEAPFDLLASEGWALVAVTKAAGAAAPRYHKFVFGTRTWTHGSGASMNDWGADAATAVYHGTTDTGIEPWPGNLLVSGVWDSVLAASDAAFEALGLERGLQQWFDRNPREGWRFDRTSGVQAFGSVGTADQTGAVGTTLDVDDSPTLWDGSVSIPHSRTVADGFALTDARAIAGGKRRSVADGLALADARTRAAQWKRTRADALALADARTKASGRSRGIADGIAFTDAATRLVTRVHGRALADTLGLTDARTRTLAIKRTRADAFGLTDARAATHVHRVTDAFGLTDAERETRGKRLADGLGLTDARARARGKRVADGFALTDARRVAHVHRPADVLSLTDARTRAVGYRRTHADGLALADSCSPAVTTGGVAETQSVADGFALADAGTASWTAARSTDDHLLLTDQATPVRTIGSTQYTRAVADGLALTDARARKTTTKRTVADGLALTDARRATHVVVRADGIAFTDARTRAAGYRRTRADALGLTDAEREARGKRVADTLGLTDARARSRGKRLSETFGLTDAERESRGKRVSDTLGLTDQRTRTVAWKRPRADAFALADTATPILTKVGQHTRLVSDLFGLTDTRSRRVTWKRTRADGLALADARAAAHVVVRADGFALTDARTDVVAFRRSSADTLGLTDARTRTVAWKRTRADGLALTDARVLFKGKRVTVSDGLALTDARARTVTWHRTRADALGLTDQRARTVTWHRSRAEGFALTDQALRARAIRRSRADGFALADLASPQKTTGAFHHARSAADGFALTDAEREARGKRVADGLALGDQLARARAVRRTRADVLGLTDARARAVTWHRSQADGLALTDGRARVVTHVLSQADGLALSDSATRALARRRQLGDAFALSDLAAPLAATQWTVRPADSITLADATTAVRITYGLQDITQPTRLRLFDPARRLELGDSTRRLELLPAAGRLGLDDPERELDIADPSRPLAIV